MHIAIAGNIGAGKTTLTSLLANHYNFTPHYEDVGNNPYLEDFYTDMEKWAFNLQIYFLNSRFKQLKIIQSSALDVIQDRSIYEDAKIFAANLNAMGLLKTREYDNYLTLFELIESFIKPPDLIIYLKASIPTLLEQIKRRNRDYELNISEDYLTNLNNRYDAWATDYDKGKMITINMDEIDFVTNTNNLKLITNKLNSYI